MEKMSFAQTNFRVDHSYENEFALAASAEVVGILSFALMLTSIIPGVTWVYLGTTTGPVNGTFPVTIEEFSMWTMSCSTPGVGYTFNSESCNARYQVVEAFSVLATMFALLGCIFGIMPFSPVAPREPKIALTHSMLSYMASGLFSLIAWAVFYGGLVFGVFSSINPVILFSGISWSSYVVVTSGGIVSVSAWCASFCAWVLALSAMIKYDSSAAEQAVIDHRQKKEEKRRRKAELIDRLGEGAARAAREGIALELGDKLYLGGTVAGGATSALSWMNMCVAPYLLRAPQTLPVTSGAMMIINVVASTVGAVVLLIGLSDLVPRPKASVGGFAVFAVVTVLYMCNFGMAISYLKDRTLSLLAFEAAVGTIGIGFSLATTIVLYHPFKIWEKVMAELPRPAKIHKGRSGLALANTAGICALVGFGLACASVTVFLLDEQEFVGHVPTGAPTTMDNSNCPNGEGALCFVGPPENRCCQPGLVCMETAYTRFTCERPESDVIIGIRDSYSVAQAFLALFIGCSTISYVFSAISLTPNGVMDVKVALSVTFSFALVGSACGLITFAILQGYVLSSGLSGMPRECGYLLGGFVAELVAAGCGFFAWLPYHVTSTPTQENQLWEAQRALEIEKVRLETIKTRTERLRLEESLKNSADALLRGNVENGIEEQKTSDNANMVTVSDLQKT